MKVVSETPSTLTAKDFSFIPYTVGTLVILVGFGTAFLPTIEKVPLWVSLFFVFTGLAVVLLYRSKVVVFDKPNNLFTIESKGILGRKVNQHPLNQVKEIDLSVGVTSTLTRGQVRSGNTFTLSAKMADGGVAVLSSRRKTSLSVSGINLSGLLGTRDSETGRRIAAFIGVPFQEIRPPSVSEMMAAIGQAADQAMGQKDQAATPPIIQSTTNNPPAESAPPTDFTKPASPSAPPPASDSSLIQNTEPTGPEDKNL